MNLFVLPMFSSCGRVLIAFALLIGATLSIADSLAETSEFDELFSSSYEEARQKFLAAAEGAGGDLVNYPLPVHGTRVPTLFTDVVAFNMEGATRVLVLGSGTHGVEGFAGSAIQLGLLREGMVARLRPGIGLLMYHGLNPYGFFHLRRFNEDNVDLNRNFVDHPSAYATNPQYDALADLMEPGSISTWSKTSTQILFAWHRLIKGREWLQSAISKGQYTHPDGLFYGGESAAWSNVLLRQIAEEYLADASRLILIDFHTGLGEYAAAEVIVGEAADSPVQEKAREIWGESVKSTALGDSVSLPIEGALKYAFPRMLPEADVVAVSLEFGTYPPEEVFWALWQENYLYRHPSDKEIDRAQIREDLKAVFYPKDLDWRQTIWSRGRKIVYQALDALLLPEQQTE